MPHTASRDPPATHRRRCIPLCVVLPSCDRAQSPATLAGGADTVRRLPLGARRARPGAGALPRRAHSGRLVPRRRRGPFGSLGAGCRAASAAVGGGFRRRGLARGHRAGRARRRLRRAGRSRAALVAPPALRPRRLRRADRRPRRLGRSASRGRGADRARRVRAARALRRHDHGRRDRPPSGRPDAAARRRAAGVALAR